MAESYEKGRVFRDGILVVLAGAPNAGKSSLFNALLQSERAIVTPAPGTTRDFIEESISVEGIAVRLVDTAGLRVTQDEIERAGVVRTESVLKNADVILLVVDSTGGISLQEAMEGAWMALAGNNIVLLCSIKLISSALQNVTLHRPGCATRRPGMSESRQKRERGLKRCERPLSNLLFTAQEQKRMTLS